MSSLSTPMNFDPAIVEKKVQSLYDKLFISARSTDSYSLFRHQLSPTDIKSQLDALYPNLLPFNIDTNCLPFASAYATNSYQRFSDFDAANVFMSLPDEAQVRVVRRELELALDVLTARSGNYPKAGDTVDGRRVREEIPNMGSIRASLEEYVTLPGVREVPLSEFTLTGRSYSDSETKRIQDLAEAIRESGEINPLILVVDNDGPYILEGGHRAEALFLLGAKSFPALVVIDTAEPEVDMAVESSVELSEAPASTMRPRR